MLLKLFLRFFLVDKLMVSVSANQIRMRLGLTAADISDEEVLAFRDEAAAVLSEEIGKTLNASDCTEAEANAIANLAAIYCYCKVTGVASTGWSVNLGGLTFSGPAERVAQLEFLKKQVEQFIARRKRFGVSLLEGP